MSSTQASGGEPLELPQGGRPVGTRPGLEPAQVEHQGQSFRHVRRVVHAQDPIPGRARHAVSAAILAALRFAKCGGFFRGRFGGAFAGPEFLGRKIHGEMFVAADLAEILREARREGRTIGDRIIFAAGKFLAERSRHFFGDVRKGVTLHEQVGDGVDRFGTFAAIERIDSGRGLRGREECCDGKTAE
jgi:hypothetical protein